MRTEQIRQDRPSKTYLQNWTKREMMQISSKRFDAISCLWLIMIMVATHYLWTFAAEGAERCDYS